MSLLRCKKPQAGLLSQEADNSLSQGLQCFSNCFQETLGRIESNPQDSAQTEGCIELLYAATSLIQLNASALSNPHSLFVSPTSPLILGQDHLNKIPFWALVNSKFVDTHHLKTSATLPVALCLFDSSSNSTISEIANLSILFSNSNCMNALWSLDTTGSPDTIYWLTG